MRAEEEIGLASGGRELRAILHQPDDMTRLTVVLCPGRIGGLSNIAWLVDPIVARGGLAVLSIEYSGPEERCFLRDVEDVTVAAEWLRTQGIPRIALAGYSRGAIAVLNAAGSGVRSSGVVAISPGTDQARLMYGLRMHAPESRRRVALRTRGCEPEEDPLWYMQISPIYKAAAIADPVLFVHGTNDLINPIDHSWWMIKAMREAGHRNVDLVEIEGAGHFFERQVYGYVFEEVARPVTDWLVRRLAQ